MSKNTKFNGDSMKKYGKKVYDGSNEKNKQRVLSKM